MIRSKKFFAIGSIVSMATLFFSLMFGFVEDSYYYSSYYSYSYYRSFADHCEEWYVLFVLLSVVYISFSIVAIALYNKRILAINIINLVLTLFVDMFAIVVSFIALDLENFVFALVLLLTSVGLALPFHLVVEIFALIAQRYKEKPAQPSYIPQQPVVDEPVQAPANDVIEALKQLKALYDANVLTEDEYNEKRKKFVEKI